MPAKNQVPQQVFDFKKESVTLRFEVDTKNPGIHEKMVSTSNQRAKIIATEDTETTEDFFSVSSVLSVADKYKQ